MKRVRIIAGAAKGVALQVPSSGTRPSSDRLREALFSALDARGTLTEASVLDLYAGSGALGLEALSRGAAEAVFVERAGRAASLLRRNAEAVTAAIAPRRVRARIVTASAVGFVEKDAGGGYHLVLADPPYELGNAELERLLAALTPRLRPDGVLVLERAARDEPPAAPAGLELEQSRRYGDTVLFNFVPA